MKHGGGIIIWRRQYEFLALANSNKKWLWIKIWQLSLEKNNIKLFHTEAWKKNKVNVSKCPKQVNFTHKMQLKQLSLFKGLKSL